jgi:dynein heavy chain
MNERIRVRALAEAEMAKLKKELPMASMKGDWIFLKGVENLGCSSELESNLAKLAARSVHADFRVFLSVLPDANLRANLVCQSVKISLQKSRGVKRILNELFVKLPETTFVSPGICHHIVPIARFHAIVLERQKFGRIGFRSKCDFIDDAFLAAVEVVQKYENEEFPYQMVRYIIGELIYGT